MFHCRPRCPKIIICAYYLLIYNDIYICTVVDLDYDKFMFKLLYLTTNVMVFSVHRLSSFKEVWFLIYNHAKQKPGFPHFSDMKIPYFFKTFSRLKFDFSRPGLFAIKKKLFQSLQCHLRIWTSSNANFQFLCDSSSWIQRVLCLTRSVITATRIKCLKFQMNLITFLSSWTS